MCVVMRYTTSQKLLLDVMTVSMNALHRWARPHRTYTMNLAGFIYSYTRRRALCVVGGACGVEYVAGSDGPGVPSWRRGPYNTGHWTS